MSNLISREAAIDGINNICPVDTEYDCTLLDRVDVRCVLPDLPSAQPERKKGRWIPCTKNGLALTEMVRSERQKWYGFKCSNCGSIYKGNALSQSPFCQKCGADMRGEEK